MSQSRSHRSRSLILDVLQQASQPLSAQEIFVQLRSLDQPLGLATVYRTVEVLRQEGVIQSINLGDHQSHYQLLPSSGHNRHHLICTLCHKVVPLSMCPVHNLEDQLEDEYGFTIDYHVLDFYGTCADCRV